MYVLSLPQSDQFISRNRKETGFGKNQCKKNMNNNFLYQNFKLRICFCFTVKQHLKLKKKNQRQTY